MKNTPSNKITFAAIYLSPIHPEMEIMRRIKYAAEQIGSKCYFIDPKGREFETGRDVTKEIEFVFVFDPSHITLIDTFKYHVHWFCPGLTSPSSHLLYKALSDDCDAHLHFPSNKITAHKNIFSPYNNYTPNAYLFPSVPNDFCLPASKRETYSLFYCGINVDQDEKNGVRHGDMFSELDKHNSVNFFGPRKIGTKLNWSGFKNYMGDIPFDGYSVIKYANESGICLAIQHDLHNLNGMVTNRLFEGCAAGCLIITDEIPFMKYNFGDSLLYVNRNGCSQEDIAKQILKHINWANNNTDSAYNKAKKSQSIFKEKYVLDSVLQNIILEHENYKSSLINIESSHPLVDVIIDAENCILNNVREQIRNQSYENLHLIFIVDSEIKKSEITDFFHEFNLDVVVFETRFSNYEVTPLLSMSINHLKGDFFIFYNDCERWLSKHIDRLVSIMSDGILASYSGYYINNDHGMYNNPMTFKPIQGLRSKLIAPLINEHAVFTLPNELLKSSVIFSTKLLSYIEKNTQDVYSGNEVYLLLALVTINEKTIRYSGKLTVYYNEQTYYAQNHDKLVFEGKSYATFKQSIIELFYNHSNLNNIIHKWNSEPNYNATPYIVNNNIISKFKMKISKMPFINTVARKMYNFVKT